MGGAAEGTVVGGEGFLGIEGVSRAGATPRGPRRTASKSSLIFTAILSFTEGSCVGGRSDVLAVSNIECVRFALRSHSSRTDTGAGEAATAGPPRSPPRGAIARFFTRASACRGCRNPRARCDRASAGTPETRRFSPVALDDRVPQARDAGDASGRVSEWRALRSKPLTWEGAAKPCVCISARAWVLGFKRTGVDDLNRLDSVELTLHPRTRLRIRDEFKREPPKTSANRVRLQCSARACLRTPHAHLPWTRRRTSRPSSVRERRSAFPVSRAPPHPATHRLGFGRSKAELGTRRAVLPSEIARRDRRERRVDAASATVRTPGKC